jgi:hypothetical protein
VRFDSTSIRSPRGRPDPPGGGRGYPAASLARAGVTPRGPQASTATTFHMRKRTPPVRPESRHPSKENSLTLPAHQRAPRSLEERFWEKVDKQPGDDGCWFWTAYVERSGHGRIGIGRSGGEWAHRVAWRLLRPDEPIDGFCLHHRPTCPKHCVNPRHLERLTRSEHTKLHRPDLRRRRSRLIPAT